jgi:deazaflavin-dependent oxidoreductase (nitroreductase family)
MVTQRRLPFFVPIVNPLARRLLRLGPFMGPNALLGVRGRKSGVLRTTPVALVAEGERRWIVGTFGAVNWVRNLRQAGEGTLSVGRRTERVRAVELDLDAAAAFFAGVVAPSVGRTALGRWMLRSFLQAPDILDDPRGAAARRPVFEIIRQDGQEPPVA